MGSIRHKLRMVIIIMMVLQPNTGTETNDGWFATYGEERDGMEDGVSRAPGEAGMAEDVDVGEGIAKTERNMSDFV